VTSRFVAPFGLALALAISPAAAATERVGFAPDLTADPPQLVGSEVAWQQVRCLRRCGDSDVSCSPAGQVSGYRVQLGGPGRSPRTLFSKRLHCAMSGPNFGVDYASALVSPGSLALQEGTFTGDELAGDRTLGSLRAGRRNGGLTRLYECETGAGDGGLRLVALDGDRLAYDTTPCGGSRRLAVRDLTSGETRPLAHPPLASIAAIAMSGRHLAYVAGRELAVHDHLTGARVYGWTAPGGTELTGVALDEDGRAAVVMGPAGSEPPACGTQTLAWLSAAEPAPHALPGEPCGSRLAFRGGRVVYQTERDVRDVTLDGTHGQVAFFGDVEHRAFDFDGTHVAFATRTCADEMAVYRHRVTELTFLAGQPRCEARIATRRLRAIRGRAGVTLRCPRACTGIVRLRAGRTALGSRRFGSRRRGAKTVRVPLNRRGRSLARRGPVAVTVSVGVRDRNLARHTVRRRATLR
jgi:hypothetical protein